MWKLIYIVGGIVVVDAVAYLGWAFIWLNINWMEGMLSSAWTGSDRAGFLYFTFIFTVAGGVLGRLRWTEAGEP